MYKIRMGIPEMAQLWERLRREYQNGTINKNDEQLYKKWGKTLKKLSRDPFYTSLHTHEILPLTNRYGIRVW